MLVEVRDERGGLRLAKVFREPAVLLARDLTMEDLRRIEPLLPRLRGFVIERGDLPSDVQMYLAASNRAAVIGVPRAADLLEGRETVLVDGIEGRVLVEPDPATAERYRLLRHQGRPGTADEDVARIARSVMLPEIGRLAAGADAIGS